jgi:hypothetical protein
VASTGPQTPAPIAPGRVDGPFVQAGAMFSMRMDAPIDTFYTAPGTPITATLLNPLVDSTGRIAAAYGAKVHGTVEGAGTEERPRLRVQIDSIDTINGTLPMQAAIRHAQQVRWAGPARVIAESSAWDADTFLTPGDVEPGDRPGGPFTPVTGTPYYAEVMQRPREVRVPQNAMVQVVLIRPIVLRGTTVSSR